MNKFSANSEYNLSMAHKDFQILFRCVILDFDCTIVKSFESREETDRYYKEGKSKIPYPTGHNTKPSVYIDVAPFINGQVSWNPKEALAFAFYVKGVADQLYRIGSMKHHIRLGADWDKDLDVNDQTFNDYCHFELILSEEEKSQLIYYEL